MPAPFNPVIVFIEGSGGALLMVAFYVAAFAFTLRPAFKRRRKADIAAALLFGIPLSLCLVLFGILVAREGQSGSSPIWTAASAGVFVIFFIGSLFGPAVCLYSF